MQVIEGAVGGATFRMCVPDGACRGEMFATFRPRTVEEFEATIDVLGGVEAFKFPVLDTYYEIPARSRSGAVSVLLYPPPAAVAGVDGGASGPRPHPFFGEYAARKAVKP